MVITTQRLNEIEQILTDGFTPEEIYTFTSNNGHNLNCSYNQILAQIEAGKVVQIKFSNIPAVGTTYQYDENLGEDVEYTVTAYFTAYDFIMATAIDANCIMMPVPYIVYLVKYGYFGATTASGILTAIQDLVPEG